MDFFSQVNVKSVVSHGFGIGLGQVWFWSLSWPSLRIWYGLCHGLGFGLGIYLILNMILVFSFGNVLVLVLVCVLVLARA